MTLEQKIEFVSELTNSVQRELLAALPRVPTEWDGHELRQWIADRFAQQSYTLARNRRRLRDYRNAVAVNNL